MSDGKQWPIGVIISTILIIIACIVTIYLALLQPVQEDGDMMMDYHTLDTNVNEIIIAKIAFDKKYKLSYTGEGVSQKGSQISYRLVDLEGNAVNDADFELHIIRPIVKAEEIILTKPRVEDGNYYFDDVKVPKMGRWNILVKVTVANDFRHMNLKSDTTDKDVYEYGFDKPMRNYAANGGRTL